MEQQSRLELYKGENMEKLEQIIQAYRNILDAQLFKTIELEIEIARLQQEIQDLHEKLKGSEE